MAKQRYIVMPEIQWVNGALVPLDRIVLLTPDEARFDLAQGRIYLDGTQPPVTPAPPALVASDVAILLRGGLSHPVTMADLVAFLGGQAGGPTLALSKLVFQAGVSAGAVLAGITMPAGWQAAAETTFGGRVAVSGANLVAAVDISPSTAVSSTMRLKATSPDTLTSITATFAVAFEAVSTAPNPLRPIGVATGLLHGMPLAIAA